MLDACWHTGLGSLLFSCVAQQDLQSHLAVPAALVAEQLAAQAGLHPAKMLQSLSGFMHHTTCIHIPVFTSGPTQPEAQHTSHLHTL